MNNKVCYKLDELLKLIPDFTLKRIHTIEESEDTYGEVELYYFVRNQSVEKVSVYYSLWVSTSVYLHDGSIVDLLASNVNSRDHESPRIVKNNIISPRLTINSNYVEATEDLKIWLNNLGITDKSLNEIIETFEVYSVIEYPGVFTPYKYTNYKNEHCWGYSSEILKLDEREIKTALDSIDDELIREKIRCILYARVFRK